MDIETDILGEEPPANYIKTILNNAYIMRDSFPIKAREVVVDILGGSGKTIRLLGKEYKTDELADMVLKKSSTIYDVDTILDTIIGESYINLYTRWLIWSEILKYKYPIKNKEEFITYARNLLNYGIDPEDTSKNMKFPVTDPTHLLLSIIASNPDLISTKAYKKAVEWLKQIETSLSIKPGETVEEHEVQMTDVVIMRIPLPNHSNVDFSLYIPPSENMFILTACRAVVRIPSGAYNPMIIYGPEKSGKTYLLTAMKNEIERMHRDMGVIFLPGNEFATVDPGILSRYGVVIIDDLDLIEGDIEGVIPIIVGLVEGGTQVIISMKSDPNANPILKEYIIDRFEGHIVEECYPLDHNGLIDLMKAWVNYYNHTCEAMGIEYECRVDTNILTKILDDCNQDIERSVAILGIAINIALKDGREVVLEDIEESMAYLPSLSYEGLVFRPGKPSEPVGETVSSVDVVGGAMPKEMEPERVEVARGEIAGHVSAKEIKYVEKGEEPAGMVEGKGEDLIPGLSYLIEAEDLRGVYSVFSTFINEGFPAVGICRSNPKMLQHKYSISTDRIVWLTDKSVSGYRTLSSVLENILYFIDEFIDKNVEAKVGMILIDGLEYLISNNTFNTVLKFIRHLVDDISETSFILLIPVSPYAIGEQELKILEREMETIGEIKNCTGIDKNTGNVKVLI